MNLLEWRALSATQQNMALLAWLRIVFTSHHFPPWLEAWNKGFRCRNFFSIQRHFRNCFCFLGAAEKEEAFFHPFFSLSSRYLSLLDNKFALSVLCRPSISPPRPQLPHRTLPSTLPSFPTMCLSTAEVLVSHVPKDFQLSL